MFCIRSVTYYFNYYDWYRRRNKDIFGKTQINLCNYRYPVQALPREDKDVTMSSPSHDLLGEEGNDWYRKGHFDEAVRKYSHAIKLGSEQKGAWDVVSKYYGNRAQVCFLLRIMY
jgi:hypothetical protein